MPLVVGLHDFLGQIIDPEHELYIYLGIAATVARFRNNGVDLAFTTGNTLDFILELVITLLR